MYVDFYDSRLLAVPFIHYGGKTVIDPIRDKHLPRLTLATRTRLLKLVVFWWVSDEQWIC